VAEIGPGDSVGTAAAALLTGVEHYYAFDVVPHADARRSERILDELVELLARREPIPDGDEFPNVHPRLRSYAFPADVLPQARLRAGLAEPRVEAVRASIRRLGDPPDAARQHEPYLLYDPAWMVTGRRPPEPLDLVLSQAVMEHVDDLERAYRATFEWLRPGGFASHDIDLTSHGFARAWSGHWTYGRRAWRVISGRRPFAINRIPASGHLRLLETAGFELVAVEPSATDEVAVRAADVAADIAWPPTADDLRTPSLYLLARRA
jgi:SAM-dependent methyltransferase